MHLIAQLSMSGAIPPLLLLAFMAYAGTTLPSLLPVYTEFNMNR